MAIFAKNVRFLYYKEANKKRHLPLKVAPMCAKAHIIGISGQIRVVGLLPIVMQLLIFLTNHNATISQ